jgi:hypothetical protein
VAEGHFRKETRSALDGGGAPPHTERAIPGPLPSPRLCIFPGRVVVDQVATIKKLGVRAVAAGNGVYGEPLPRASSRVVK